MKQPAPAPGPAEVLAQATELVLRYGRHTAVDTSSFALPLGGVTVLIGPNGSGKSTLLHALAGLVTPAAGTLLVLGTDPITARSKVSVVLQSMTVSPGTPLTVGEAVLMGRYASLGLLRRPRAHDAARVSDALAQMAITDLKRRQLAQLSGGQRQRVFVAQAIAQDHEVLLLDEPLTGLDLVSARTIDRLIHSERDRGHSVVLTSHDLDEARAADYVILLRRRVIAAGPPEQVLTPEHLRVAYGIGDLHAVTGDGDQLLLDDPWEAGKPEPRQRWRQSRRRPQ